MTAAYDDDKISSRRQENVKNNSDVPVTDFSLVKTVAITLDKSISNENGTMNENSEGLDRREEELSFSESSVESKTVNSCITSRCVDVENVAANKSDENCTSLELDEVGNSLETCLMLRKQKNIDKITYTDRQETFSCIDVRNSIIDIGEIPARKENDAKINNDENFIDTNKSYVELITNCSELQLSSVNTSRTMNHKSEEKDLNYNLTDENKSQEFIVNNTQDIIIGNEISPVNFNPQENGEKIIEVLHEPVSKTSADSLQNLIYATTMNPKDEKSPQNVYRFGAGNIIAEKIANFEYPKEEESFEEYDPECEMSFHEAIRAGDAKSVEILVARGVVSNIDEPDWNVSGDPPLLVAATNHSLPVLRALLTNGCDPGVRSPRGETALHRAIINGSPSSVFEIVEELLKHGCPSTVKEAGGGLTALHILTRQLAHAQSSKTLHHSFDIALKTLALLAKVGPVDAKDHQGRSALHLLASSSTFGNSHKVEIEPMIKTLLNAGADPALKNDRGETPLHEALECGALNTAFLLIPHTPISITSRYGETPLHIAARKNQPEVVDSLLKRGEDPSFQDAGGNTPLHLASARGFHHTVSLLVTSPLAQLEKTNDEGLTSLQVAAESGFVNAVKLLLKAGADPSQTAHYCVTTLHRHPDISVLINHELTRRRQLAA